MVLKGRGNCYHQACNWPSAPQTVEVASLIGSIITSDGSLTGVADYMVYK